MPQIASIFFSPGLLLAFGTLASLIGLTIWWIIRKKEQRVWLPTVRILPREHRALPRLMLRLPPIAAFLAFLSLCLIFLFVSSQPKSQIFKPFEPNQSKMLIFVDLSPSISASTTIEELIATTQKTCDVLINQGKVYFASSILKLAIEVNQCNEVLNTEKFIFHRAGLKLGEAMKRLYGNHPDLDQIYIISDQNQHTWSGFNWAYLKEEVQVFFIKVQAQDINNIFINHAKMFSKPRVLNRQSTVDFDVELIRTNEKGSAEGTIDVLEGGKEVATFPFSFAPQKKRLVARLTWTPADNHDDHEDKTLEFRLKSASADQNFLPMDDTFKARYSNEQGMISLVAESAGEQALEDPMNPLQTALETLGFVVEKRDYLSSTLTTKDYGLKIYVGGSGAKAERFCPQNKPQQTSDAASGDSTGKLQRRDKIWLAPMDTEVDFFELCRCLSWLLAKTHPLKEEACEYVHTRKDWALLLPSVGGKQLGGSIGTNSEAFGYFFKKDENSPSLSGGPSIDLLALNVPLSKSPTGGVSLAKIPLLVRDLLTWHGLYEKSKVSQSESWPRIEDIVESFWDMPDAQKLSLNSNVPYGESEMNLVSLEDLPPIFNPNSLTSASQAPMKRDVYDPLPWIKLAVGAMILVTFFEIITWILQRLFRAFKTQDKLKAMWIVLMLPFVDSNKAFARVDFGIIGPSSGALSTKELARELASRTSIELTKEPFSFSTLNPISLDLPWLWVTKLDLVLGPDKSLHPDIILWIKRGGFLVIETNMPTEGLSRLTSKLEPTFQDPTQGASGKNGWLPLPPDHELMRSFYLLDALPDCQGEIWRGLRFDGRLAVLAIPYKFIESLKDQPLKPSCGQHIDQERSVRIFVNLTMVALATDYKKDQIHLPEILKRLR